MRDVVRAGLGFWSLLLACACVSSKGPPKDNAGSGGQTAAAGNNASSVGLAGGSQTSGGGGGAGTTARVGAVGTGGESGNAGPSTAGGGGSAGHDQIAMAAMAGRDSAAGAGGTVAAGDCGSNLLPVPDDPGQRGPWDVGVRTATIGRLTVEVFYPALPGSTAGKPEVTYNLAKWLPPQEQSKIPPANSPDIGPIGGHLYRDVDVDGAHGPYPVVIFIHGTASMRIASGSTNVHWASRGFVVLAADYPGLGLLDQLNSACGYPTTGDEDVPGDVDAQIQAMTSGSGDVAFLAGHADMKRLGISGHSQGACLAATLSTVQNVQIVMPMTGSTTVSPSSSLKSIMWIAGLDDTVIGYDSVLLGNVVCPANPLPATSNVDGYNGSPGPPDVQKRIVGITGGGHLVPTDLCQKNQQGKNAVEEASADGVCGVDTAVIIGLPALFDCGSIDWKDGVAVVNYVSTAALEETLQCRDRSAQFANLKANVPLVGDFQHAP